LSVQMFLNFSVSDFFYGEEHRNRKERDTVMYKKLLLLIPVILLTGCYTMLYPPPEYFTYEEAYPDSLLDSSVVNGVNINIYNNIDNEYLGRYYQDSRYFRHYGWYDDYYWDPYYYNYDSYHHHHNWDRNRYRVGRGHWDGKVRKPERKRRTDNLRRESNMPISPEYVAPVGSKSPAPSSGAAWNPKTSPVKEAKEEPKKRKVRSIEKESKEKQPETEKKEGKKERRKDSPRR